MSIPNSQEAELKRQRIALRGLIKRREAAIDRAQTDISRAEMRLRFVEADLREYRAGKL